MDLRSQQQAEEDSSYRKLKAAVGLALIVIGLVGVVWIAERIFALGDGPRDIPLVANFVAFDAAARTIVTPGGSYQFPEGVYFAAGLFLYILALTVVATLIKALISAGANLMGHDVAIVLNSFRDELRRFKEYLEKQRAK
jgi:hypothetical protein